ncbi:sulfatase [Vallitalea longa]|uniref:Sulfatase n=1 Tax=Vallitalea longa TaxID=2936439 RepID=A0A9W5YHU1_9FIRM|nr:sulfatase [Vallitalea longa]GKX31498.1 sulfatase [Vallitalea longa]
MKTILILIDSLNRHFLKTYNEDSWIKTPNIDRLAKKSVVFDNHWMGSAPCMPARRDIFTGRLNFLERNWGPIEPFDITLPEKLRENDIFTHMVTDHYHYFEIGGENYCQLFNTWDLIRGQESDPWVSKIEQPSMCEEHIGRIRLQYELNRMKFKKEEDYPSPKTFASACSWLEENKNAKDFFLMVEAFDPHEPFDCPKEYLDMYDDDYEGPRYDWPDYKPVEESPEALKHIRNRYAGTMTMMDKWLGKLFNKMDEDNMWEDTMVILTADHGHMLGEHGYMAKNYMQVYNELAHLPFIVHLPGDSKAGTRINELTQNIDIMPTVLDYHKIDIPESVKGCSLTNLLSGEDQTLRDVVLYGYHGKAVNMTDGRYTYFRAPIKEDNYPLYIYTAMPTGFRKYIGKERADEIDMGRFLKYTDYPVYKIPINYENQKDGSIKYIKESLIFDIEEDYQQKKPINNKAIEKELIDKIIKAMKDSQAPGEQYERLGLL